MTSRLRGIAPVLVLAFSVASIASIAGCKKESEPANKASDPDPEKTGAAKPTEKPPEKAATKPTEKPLAKSARPFDASAIAELPIKTLSGDPSKIADHSGKALLLVNVASKCGLTPQYGTLESMQKKYAAQGFSVLGFPSNQFGGQEPGTADEIAEFCSATYGVTFPMFEKIEVNGDGRHPIYEKLTAVEDASGTAGDVKWNFEKFVVSADGKTIHRFRSKTEPNAPEVIAAIEAGLPKQ